MTYQQPIVVDAGLVSVVVPDRGKRLTSRAWADIQLASILADGGRHEPAAALVRQVENRLKVNDAHRRAVRTSPEAERQAIAAASQRRATAQRMRAMRLAGALRDPAPTDRIVELLRKAEESEATAERLRATDKGKNRKAVKEHRTEAKLARKEADALRRAQLEQHWSEQAIGESTDYAQARGEEVIEEEVHRATFLTDEDGGRLRHRRDARPAGIDFPGHRAGDAVLDVQTVKRKRVLTRDGLRVAHERQQLDGREGSRRGDARYATGRRYRDAFEALAGLPSRNETGAGGGVRAPQVRIAEAGEILAVMRRGQSARHIAALDDVCGRGFQISQAAATRGGVPALQRRLRAALDHAAEQWAKACKDGEIGQSPERVRAVDRLLAQVR